MAPDKNLVDTVNYNSLGAKNLKMLLSQPSSYLPPFFYSKYNWSIPQFLSSLSTTSSTAPQPVIANKEELFRHLNKRDSLAPAPDSILTVMHNKIQNQSSVYSKQNSLNKISSCFPLSAMRWGAEQATPHTCKPRHGAGSSGKIFFSYLSGMNVKLAGRLMTQSIRPRFTVQSFQEGSLARVKVHYVEKSRFTGKNKRGAFSFTVTISHVFN